VPLEDPEGSETHQVGCGCVGEVNLSDWSMQVESSATATRGGGYGGGLWISVLCTCMWKSSGGGRPVLDCLVYNKRQMSSKMGESQHSAISFRREWTGHISGERYRLLLLLACYL
jgi:hypothetical protein